MASKNLPKLNRNHREILRAMDQGAELWLVQDERLYTLDNDEAVTSRTVLPKTVRKLVSFGLLRQSDLRLTGRGIVMARSGGH